MAKVSYVPEPSVPTSDYRIGCLHFPGWKQGSHSVWINIQGYPERKPLLGWYDEHNPEVTDWEIKWALEHGIQFFAYCWYRDPGTIGQPVTVEKTWLSHAIHEGLFHARYGDRFEFAIMWENHHTHAASMDDLMNNLMPFWIETYFKHPCYVKVDNKPLLLVFNLDDMIGDLGGEDKVREAVDRMKEACVDAGFDGLILPVESRNQENEVPTKSAVCNFDYAFAYGWHKQEKRARPEQAIAVQLESMNSWQNSGTIPLLPTASMGWDPMPWQSNDPTRPWLHPDEMIRWQLNPAEFKEVLEGTKAIMDAMPEDQLGHRMLLLDNWNEWGEGHYIAPHAEYGFGYLQAVREVFTNADNEPDYRLPQDLGLGPYETLWNKYLESQAKK